jgi:hypothetical protein
MPRTFTSLLICIAILSPQSVVGNSLPKNWRQALVSIEVEIPVQNRMLGAGQYQEIGTGFWMTTDTAAPYRGILFTANHVFKEACDSGITIVQLRVEGLPGTQVQRVPLTICDKQIIQQNVVFVQRWISHPTADIAAIIPPASNLPLPHPDINPLTPDLLPTTADLQKWHVAEGDDVLALAFYPNIGRDKPSSAIVRQGVISEFEDQHDSFLVSLLAYPGNSGAPVLLKPNAVHIALGEGANEFGNVNPPFLMGVIIEYIPYQEAAISPQTKHVRIMFEENSGLTRVVRSEQVRELLTTMSAMLPKK